MAETKKQIIIYSDDSSVRSSIVSALGVRAAKDLPEHELHEFATGSALRAYVDSKIFQVVFAPISSSSMEKRPRKAAWAWPAN
jgi:hypothetical protein